MTLKVHHSVRMKLARKVMQCIRRLTGQMGMCPDACRRALVACIQALTLYGAELWCDVRKSKAGVTNFRSWKSAGESGDGELPDHQPGFVMAESGPRPAESLLNNRSRRHVLRLIPTRRRHCQGTAYVPF